MKNLKAIFLSLAIIAISICSFSQTSVRMRNAWGGYANDTAIGTNSTHLDIQSQRWFKVASMQIIVTKINSNQTVARKILFEASNDGVNYIPVGTDTMTCTNVTTQSHIWVVEGGAFEYYRAAVLANYTISKPATDTLLINGYVIGQSNTSNTNTVVKMLSPVNPAQAIDSVTNTGTNYLTTKCTKAFERVSIQVVCTKKTGTQAGTVTLQGSNDGVNFVTVNTGYLINDITTAPFTTGGSATLTATNVTTSTQLFVLRYSPYQYYRVSWTGSGTMLSTLSAFILGNY